jgi:glyoxylase-like metal-dependent hydrolase (beta-lactamase superfamily II)
MTITPPRALLATALFTASVSLAHAQPPAAAPPAAPPAPAPLVIKQIKPELFMVTGQGGNTTVRVTPNGLVVVGTKNAGQPIYDDLVAKIRTVSTQPIVWVIDTHHHADHTGNNGRFLAAGAKVIAQTNLATELGKFTPPPNNPAATAPAKPSQTYDTSYTINQGGKRVELKHYAPGHTDGDTIVWFPDLKVVSTGDEFVVRATGANIDYGGGASVAGWIHSLDEVLKLDWDTAIAGHGDDPYSRAEVVTFQGKLKTLLARAREAVAAGATRQNLMTKVKTDDLWGWPATYWDAARTAGLYAEAGGK